MAMDAKDLRIDSALGAHSDDGNTKYAQSATAFQTNGNKPYHDIGSNSLAKVDVQTARPCAIIGPDRVVPPQSTIDAYIKKAPVEPWPCTDNIYQHPPEYPIKPTDYQHSRNISPRQTFQENMQRIMVQPSYASMKNSEDHCLKNTKLMPLESKFCDVPYTISPVMNEPKIVKSSDGLVFNNNSNQPLLSHGWSSSGVNVRPLRPYGASDLYQYPEYSNCPGPRPISMIRPHRNVQDDMPQVYPDRHHEANIRFKPYPTAKERPHQNPHSRYDYISNYPNAFQPHAPYPPPKYELQKSIPPHSYSVFPPVPLKYLERRMPVPPMEKYPRSPNQQMNFNQPYCNQNIPSTYATLPGHCLQNRAYPYPPDPTKNMIQNRFYFDSNNTRKYYTSPENMFLNDINRPPTIKPDLMYQAYSPINVQSLPQHHMYRKDSNIKAYEHPMHYRNIDYPANMNPLGRLPLQFSPQTMSISPSDSNASNDTTQILGNGQEDCGYASQSSTASIRSLESGVNRVSNDIYRRHEMTMLHNMNKFGQKINASTNSKDKKDIDVRQFLQMWNEGDDEGNNDNNKETIKQKDSSNSVGRYDSGNNQEQLYVLDLVNVPKEELGKYEHIQKISKLPENIKGYNSIELLNQYEKLVESPALNHFPLTTSQPKQKDLHIPVRNTFPRQGTDVSNAARPPSPLDVEAKISQSVIHKEVGCNFEIRPCSPQMMNVDLATPVHNVLGERLIEKVVNPVKTKSPICQRIEESNNISSRSSPKVQSCKMAQYPSPHVNDSLKTNYCLQDLESNSGVCLASLPRLDNDIELNFPEINQQFINDNKISSMRDLPLLDIEAGGNQVKSKIHNQPFTSEHLNSGSDSEKDVSKLSKYRKQKRSSVPNDMTDTLNTSQHRTDSVIIKNPENAKSQEDYIINIPSINTPSVDNIMDPIKIVVENNTPINYSDKNISRTDSENFNDYKVMDSDTAIDFSLNKCADVQSNSLNNDSTLDDALQNNIVDDKNICRDNDTTAIVDSIKKLCSETPSKGVDENSSSDNFPILQPKSPAPNNTSSRVLNSNIELPAIDEVNQAFHDTVITNLRSKDISLHSEEMRSHDDLPSLSRDSESLSTEKSECNGNISENVAALSNDTDNQALNYCLAEHPTDEMTPICENKHNVLEENQKNYDINEDVKSKSCSQQEEIFSARQEAAIGSDKNIRVETNRDKKDDSSGDFVVQESGDGKIKAMPIESVCNEVTPQVIVINNNAITNLDKPSEQDSNDDTVKNDDCVGISKKGSEENCIEAELTKVNNTDCNKAPYSTNVTPVSINYFDSTNVPCTEIDTFKINDPPFNAKTDDIFADIKNEIEISPPLLTGNSSSEKIKDHIKSYRLKYNFTFNKELYSPRVQNLLMYDEGFCGSITGNDSENKDRASNIFYRNRQCRRSVDDDLKVIYKLHFEEKHAAQEFETNTNTDNSSGINNDIIYKTTSDESVEFVKNGTTNERSKQLDDDINIQQNDITNNDAKYKNHTDFDVGNHNSESLLDVGKEKTNHTIIENNIEINAKTFSHVKQNYINHLTWDELPIRRKRTLKRSLSESAVIDYTSAVTDMKTSSNNNFIAKRAKTADSEILVESQVLTENITNFIQNRRNSVSTIYNDENVSFCILIDNDCVLSEETDSCQKICYTEIPDECLTTICTEEDASNSELPEDISYGTTAICNEDEAVDSELTAEIYYEHNPLMCDKVDNIISEFDSENVLYETPENFACENDLISQSIDDGTIEESWVEDVACIETVFSDEIAEDVVISAPLSPKDSESSEEESDDTNFGYNINENEHTNRVKHIYGDEMCDDDAELVEKLYRTPQMNVNQTLINRESQLSQEYSRYYDNESLERILSESNTLDTCSVNQLESASDSLVLPNAITSDDVHGNKENLQDLFPKQENTKDIYSAVNLPDLVKTKFSEEEKSKDCDDCLVHSCESSCDNFVSYKKEEKLQFTTSSSPEVSSTTSEEKGPAILLKIRSYKGSKISEVNEMSASFNHTHSQRPLITKAAQKYIPPLKETIHDLKVKIRLPKQSLYKLQQLKKSKEKPKIDTNCSKLYVKSYPQEIPKKAKPKPKFEDVLMSIDEIQLKKHKTKNKKIKQSIPKVIIKKNENGAHYASTQSKETFNPDLTGRKWQPWVFLEKSHFVDKMALKQKFKAIYNHRKKTFVLAENFRKYKSVPTPKFVISHPDPNDNSSSGKLKYTIRLKHVNA